MTLHGFRGKRWYQCQGCAGYGAFSAPVGHTDSYGRHLFISIGSRCIVGEEESTGTGIGNACVGDWDLGWVASNFVISR